MPEPLSWSTLDEAAAWAKAATGEDWPLPRLIEAMPGDMAVWLDPPRNVSEVVLSVVFQGRRVGFMAPVLLHSDAARLAVVRDNGTLSLTRRPDGEVVKIEPPMPFAAAELRFSAAGLLALAADVAAAAQQVTKAAAPPLEAPAAEPLPDVMAARVATKSTSATWPLKKPKRDDGLAHPIFRVLKAAWDSGEPRPTALDVLDAFRAKLPSEVVRVLADGCDYFDKRGNEESADLDSIRKRIDVMTAA